MSDSDRTTSLSLADHVRRLTGGGGIELGLYEIVLPLCRAVLREFDETSDEAEDLAGDFLLWLSEKGNLTVRSKSMLKSLIRSYWSRRNAPASREFWGILSEALKALAAEGLVRRIDAPAHTPNSNTALWSAADPDRDNATLDPMAFAERADRIPSYPKNRKGVERVAKGGKLLSPAEARELAFVILEAAKAPVEMRAVHAEAKRHVILLQIVSPPARGREGGDSPGSEGIERYSDEDPGGGSGATSTRPFTIDDEVLLQAEAKILAERIWLRLAGLPPSDGIGPRELLCGYVIPKFLRHSSATLEQFGSPQRMKELVDKILAEVGSLAAVSEACDPEERWILENLIELALEMVGSDFCPILDGASPNNPENPHGSSFIKL